MEEHKKNILVIGAPNVGKTHLGAQLYGRLKLNNFQYQLRETPDDISLFQDILKKLNNGIPGEHTPISESRELILPIKDKNGQAINLIYPDYGGEQISNILKNRMLDRKWQNQIETSTDWILIIRPSLIEKKEDITSRFYKHLEKANASEDTIYEGLTDNSTVFYIELLQILLYGKRLNLNSTQKPFLMILLSCWDEVEMENKTPNDLFIEKMPLLSDFIKSNWESNYQILGVAATGTTLSIQEPNKEFMIDGPEFYGYVVDSDGNKNKDLTVVLEPLFC
jgi:hypothetical protein